jgi:hypothetical protein
MLLRGGAWEATHRPQTLSQQYGRKCYGATRNCEAITNRKVYGSSTAFVSVIILPFLLPHLFWRSSPTGCKIKKLSWSNFLFSWAFIRFVSALLSFIQAVGRNNNKKKGSTQRVLLLARRQIGSLPSTAPRYATTAHINLPSSLGSFQQQHPPSMFRRLIRAEKHPQYFNSASSALLM